jgi:predicted phosphodiesterase
MSIEHPLATPERLAVLGDTHGDTDFALRALAYARHDRGADVVLQLGDFGFTWPESPFAAGVSALACDLDMPVLWVDGNHENHDALDAIPIDPATGLRPIAPGVWHLPRGYRWTWGGLRFLALGGATSLDSHLRTPGLNWFPQESLSRDDVHHAVSGGPADVMLCHDAPDGVDIPGLTPNQFPPAAIRGAEQHRRILRLTVDRVQPRWLFHGHYHVSYVADLAGRGYRCTVRGLAHNKTATMPHAVFVQPLRHLAEQNDAAEGLTVADTGRRTSRS